LTPGSSRPTDRHESVIIETVGGTRIKPKHRLSCHCGIYTHHQRRSNPSEYGYDVGCLEGVEPFALGSFQGGSLRDQEVLKAGAEGTGNTISGAVRSRFHECDLDKQELQHWLLGVLAASPSLTLYFNGRELHTLSNRDARAVHFFDPKEEENEGIDCAGHQRARVRRPAGCRSAVQRRLSGHRSRHGFCPRKDERSLPEGT
jgi:hypothetical protein